MSWPFRVATQVVPSRHRKARLSPLSPATARVEPSGLAAIAKILPGYRPMDRACSEVLKKRILPAQSPAMTNVRKDGHGVDRFPSSFQKPSSVATSPFIWYISTVASNVPVTSLLPSGENATQR